MLQSHTFSTVARCTLALASIAVFLTSFSDAAEQRILYLNSYNLGYRWTDDVTASVHETLSRDKELQVYSEFLDAKRFPSEAKTELKLRYLKSKYKTLRFDGIFCSDNAALDFVIRNREDPMFIGLPIVFCGITNVEDYATVPSLWGVQEIHNFETYIDEIHRMMPKAKRLHLVINGSSTGRLYRSMFEQFEQKWQGKLEFVYHFGYKTSEVAEKLSSIRKSDIVYYFTMTNDRSGNIVNSSQFIKTLKETCPAPIFADLTDEMNVGCLGGATNEGSVQGSKAAEMLMALLNGQDLPEKFESREITWRFDYRILKAFGIKLDSLPAGSFIINQPESVWLKYKTLIITTGIVLILLALTVLLLATLLATKRKHAKELLKEKEKAEQSDHLKTAFLQNISHEIRTPLNAMIGFSNILKHDPSLGKDAQESLGHITKGGFILRDTISNILEFSRIESQDLRYEPQDVSIKDILKSTLTFDKIATWNNGRIETIDKTPDDLALHVDDSMLVEALAQLLHNALKFSKTEPVKLLCNLEGDNVVFSIEDRGIGIVDTSKNAIFLPFQKGQEGAAEFFPGAGLGLSIALKYVTQIGGSLSLTQREGGGTRATLKVPLRKT